MQEPQPQYRERKKFVDDREPSLIRTELLKAGWQQARLYSGDYLFQTVNYKWVCITRKTIPDLLASMGKAFGKQLLTMSESYEYRILLVEGNWRTIDGYIETDRGIQRWHDSAANNYIRSWQDRGVTIERTANEGHTIRRLNELYAYYMRDVHAGGLPKKIEGDPRLLAFGEGIGAKMGKKLLERFGSLRGVACADVGQLIQVEGIGKGRAEGIFNHFNREAGTNR